MAPSLREAQAERSCCSIIAGSILVAKSPVMSKGARGSAGSPCADLIEGNSIWNWIN
jgi:hypothetical protein